ncbi:hypothetical protein L3Y34_018324 [Caenorhabditis briggsae]|uniref:Uncharacterized protein n=1 Tax=Caenorhabditis briggsae TaxID=6238 RepID=A0AAE9IUI9_CAEBR|nr:hypothetical protein L3Y34_018324 [Caenorhabditis briggsae]
MGRVVPNHTFFAKRNHNIFWSPTPQFLLFSEKSRLLLEPSIIPFEQTLDLIEFICYSHFHVELEQHPHHLGNWELLTSGAQKQSPPKKRT